MISVLADLLNRPASRSAAKTGATSAAAFAAALMASSPATAVDGKIGDIDISIDTTVTAGMSMRVSHQDCVNISPTNGGCASAGGFTRSINQDNGNLNFKRGDLISANIKAIVDISADWDDFGVFLRPRAFYDAVYTRNRLDFIPLTRDAQQRLDHSIDILDAFAYWNSEVAGMPFSLRVGKQVQNWGESLFIRGGINQFGTLDVSAIRQAGSEVREALQAIPMVYSSLAVDSSLTLEAFWQIGPAFTEPDPSGSFFQIDDNIGPGAGDIPILFVGPDTPFNPTPPFITQTDDRNEGNTLSQFGVAARYYAPWLNQGTDLGLYYVHYNSRNLHFNYLLSDAGVLNYRYVYPGSIDLIGASFNTLVAGTAFAGEISYMPNAPMALNSADQLAQTPLGAALGLGSPSLNPIGLGQATTAFIEGDIWQAQFNTITQFNTSHPISQALGADVTTFIVNPGFVWAPDAGDGAPINRPGAERSAQVFAGNPSGTQYAEQFSWGYILRLSADYNNFLNTPWTITPSVSWQHDVQGYAPGNIAHPWFENTKQYSLGIQGNYQNTWIANLSFTSFLGNASRNQNLDKDFVSISVSRAF